MTRLTQPPIIGITTYGRNEAGCFYLPGAYVDAVRLAGGIPVMLPPGELNPQQILATVQGLLFTGGGDVNPVLYQGEAHPQVYGVDGERDTFELALAKAALQADIPILGICRGLQILTVASGGSLIPHVPDEFGTAIAHRGAKGCLSLHDVEVVIESQLAAILGTTQITPVSLHHQAVRSVPLGWQLTAQAADGLIEAIEHLTHPWAIAVQWHPELSPQDLVQRRIFQALVAVAQNYAIASRNLLSPIPLNH